MLNRLDSGSITSTSRHSVEQSESAARPRRLRHPPAVSRPTAPGTFRTTIPPPCSETSSADGNSAASGSGNRIALYRHQRLSPFVPVCSGGAAPGTTNCPSRHHDRRQHTAATTTPTVTTPSTQRAVLWRALGRPIEDQIPQRHLHGLQFPAPALGVEGDLGRNTYDQPGYKDFDFTFEKYFNVPWLFSERLKIEAKGEVFNLFNRSNLWTVSTRALADSSFGKSTSQLPPRSLQLHLRASF